ncbi:hypothetical protein [Rhizobium sp. SG741]|uniref:hypothetical protein n=1 Tax=Rhizobium sp. SG741 TaxID=2587114 RepID=UPI00144886A8|nr:hypothetical protein [Rhizobium sp. SG741]NKJ03731.1 hypothetical protein [Rhizobium sp. SG741]
MPRTPTAVRSTLSIRTRSRGLIESEFLQTLPDGLEQVPVDLTVLLRSFGLENTLSDAQKLRIQQLAPCVVRVTNQTSDAPSDALSSASDGDVPTSSMEGR